MATLAKLPDEELEQFEEMRASWLREIAEEVKALDPVRQYARLISFESRSAGRHRRGPKKGRQIRRRARQVELLQFLPSGRCVPFRGVSTKGIDSLAEEIFGKDIPSNLIPADYLIERLRAAAAK